MSLPLVFPFPTKFLFNIHACLFFFKNAFFYIIILSNIKVPINLRKGCQELGFLMTGEGHSTFGKGEDGNISCGAV